MSINPHKSASKQTWPRLLWLLALAALLLILWQIPLVPLAHRQAGTQAFLQVALQNERLSANGPWPIFSAAETEALEFAARHLRQANSQLDTYRTLGVVELATNNPAGAQQELLRRLETAPNDPIARFFLGETYLRLEDTSAAIEQWESLGAQRQLMQLAKDLVEREAQAEALETLAAVIRLDANEVRARRLAARILAEQGNPEGALALYQEIITIAPQKADSYMLSGHILFDQGQYERAIVYYEAALQRNPANPNRILRMLGRSRAALGQWSGAIEAYQEAIDEDPTFPQAYVLLGDVLFKQEQYERAIVYYEEALERNPANPYWILLKLGKSHAVLNQWLEAMEAYQQAIREDSALPHAYVLVGDAACQLGRSAEARIHYGQAVAFGNQDDRVRQATEYIIQHGKCIP